MANPFEQGARIRNVNDGYIYLLIDGELRHIPNEKTFTNLFRSWSNVAGAFGPPLTEGAYLGKNPDDPAVYLIVDGKKRHITSPGVMDKFDFNWSQIRQEDLSGIPDGEPIT